MAGNDMEGFADGPALLSKFNYPTGLRIDAHGNIHVADGANNQIGKLSFE